MSTLKAPLVPPLSCCKPNLPLPWEAEGAHIFAAAEPDRRGYVGLVRDPATAAKVARYANSHAELLAELQKAGEIISHLHDEIDRRGIHDKIDWPCLRYDARRNAIATAKGIEAKGADANGASKEGEP